MLFKSNDLKEVNYYADSRIKQNEIVLESYSKNALSGSIYYILKELTSKKEYKSLKKYIVIKPEKVKQYKMILNNKGIHNFIILEYKSVKYYKKLYEAKYLINNDAFPSDFIKQNGQTYINIIDETPVMKFGKSNYDNSYAIGNKQRNLLMADYIVCQNEYTLNLIRKEYMLDNLYNGKYIISGLPKNDIFFSKEEANKIKNALNLNNKKIITYSVTFRNKEHLEEQEKTVNNLLNYFENYLTSEYVVFLKQEQKVKLNINYEQYKKIRKFPNKYELNEILNISDLFITDYSTSIFDYSVKNNQIISYAYDIENIKEEDRLYLNLKEELDVITVTNEEELYKNITNKEITYSKLKSYVVNEKGDSTNKICKFILDSSNIESIDSKEFRNNKENVIIFSGSLIKNGITSALKGLINNINLDKRNYFLTFIKDEVKKNKYLFKEFPEKINFISMEGEKIISPKEEVVLKEFFENDKMTEETYGVLEKVYKREIQRVYPKTKFNYAIDFCGYNKDIINLFMYMDAIKIRYTHSNMKEEFKTRQNIHLESLKLAYEKYDKFVAVREGMEEEINSLFEDVKPKEVVTVHNLNNINDIINKSKQPIEFQEKTYSNIEKEKLEQILNNKEIIKFINISRFSAEKGIDRLITAFDKFCRQNKITSEQAYLIIIGGHGKKFKDICDLIEEMGLKNVIIIRNIQNPLAILKKCNMYIMSSYYEGLPMTIMESLILQVPTMAVDIIGPRKFFEKGYVYLIDNSESGLLNGMNDYVLGNVKGMKQFDAEEFNKKALEEFENIF